MGGINANSIAGPTQQKFCIDLPGEAVQCWRSSDNIQVILRKHRDVIFQLKLADAQTYTVESTGSDFYNANEKKLIAGKSAGRVSFNDGERLHLWIARDFKGELLLKSAGKVMLKLEPGKLDHHQYDDKPNIKPLPIIITLGGTPQQSDVQSQVANNRSKMGIGANPQATIRPTAAAVEEDCALVCVVEGTIKGIPKHVWEMLESGAEGTGLAELDPNHIATRNWLLGQLAGAGAYVGDNWDWLKASLDNKTHAGFKLVKAKIHYVRGKVRFFFSGYSKHNKVFGPGGFGPSHDRVISIFGGAGDATSVFKATAKGIAGSFRNCALVSFIFGSATALAEWKADASKDGYDLAAMLITNVVKSLVVATVTVAIVACVVFLLMVVLEVSLSVVAVGALTIGAGTAIGYGVDAIDKKLGKVIVGESHEDGIAAVLAERMRQSVRYHWTYLKRKFTLDYAEEPF